LKAFLRARAGGLVHFVARVIDPWARIAYAQEGEDILLDRLLSKQGHGFYVDVGAHHPKRFSNTQYFYLRGWRGINIEPNPVVVEIFKQMRRRDINLQLGVSDQKGELIYYEFDDPALNTFDESLRCERERSTSYKCIGTQNIRVEPLAHVLETHLPRGQTIDFLTVDVEGLDMNVLRSNDWRRFRPRCVVSEALNADLLPASLQSSPLVTYMQEQDYRLVAKTCNSWLFLDMRVVSIPDAP
jgi:FkbM family methyltransferase